MTAALEESAKLLNLIEDENRAHRELREQEMAEMRVAVARHKLHDARRRRENYQEQMTLAGGRRRLDELRAMFTPPSLKEVS